MNIRRSASVLFLSCAIVGLLSCDTPASKVGVLQLEGLAIQSLIAQVTPSTFSIYSDGSIGAGWLILLDDDTVRLVTAAHMFQAGGSSLCSVTDSNGREWRGELYGLDPESDVAIVDVPLDFLLSHPPLIPGEADQGERAFAFGTPLSFPFAVSSGIVSKIESNYVFTDTNISPGNSGGPLVNANGEAIGMVVMVYQADFGSPLGVAVSSAQILKAVSLIERYR